MLINGNQIIETIINLDIRQWPGKAMRLNHSIDRYMNEWMEDENTATKLLPNQLVMTNAQYDILKYSRNMGNYKQQKHWPPSERIWFTEWNAFMIKVK